jgi:hypothetical protein
MAPLQGREFGEGSQGSGIHGRLHGAAGPRMIEVVPPADEEG